MSLPLIDWNKIKQGALDAHGNNMPPERRTFFFTSQSVAGGAAAVLNPSTIIIVPKNNFKIFSFSMWAQNVIGGVVSQADANLFVSPTTPNILSSRPAATITFSGGISSESNVTLMFYKGAAYKHEWKDGLLVPGRMQITLSFSVYGTYAATDSANVFGYMEFNT